MKVIAEKVRIHFELIMCIIVIKVL